MAMMRYRINMKKKQKEHSLTGRITYPSMLDAFKAVKRNRGAAGIDKVSIKMYEANLEDNLTALMKDIKTGQFAPPSFKTCLYTQRQRSGPPTWYFPLSGIEYARR